MGLPCMSSDKSIAAFVDSLESLVKDREFQGIILSTLFNDLSIVTLSLRLNLVHHAGI